MNNEKATFQDLKWIGEGRYSSVLKIKNKIIKFGFTRATITFPNNPYIIKPLLRKYYNDHEKQLFIEVIEAVHALHPHPTRLARHGPGATRQRPSPGACQHSWRPIQPLAVAHAPHHRGAAGGYQI